jgi:hypothetical protein
LCNASLRDGILPASQKRSIITPILKQAGLDSTFPASYRPIVNVSFISKIIEKLVACQLINYLDKNKLLPPRQSGFRKGHSTETLLLSLLSDIYSAIDKSQVTLLALYDVSAAFDSVDHDILLHRLSTSFGISARPLDWLTSFLSGRTSSTIFHSTRSHWIPVPIGLPQGSVLGPLLYILFTADIAPLLASCSLLSHSYADDIQSYAHCFTEDALGLVSIMSNACESLTAWLSSNRLRLNSSKTQYIWLGTHQQLSKLDLLRLSDEFPLLTFSTSVRDLGVILDQELSFTKHISLLSRSCYYHLRQLRVVSRSLSVSSATALVHAFVCCRLDYCSSLFIGLPLVRTNCLVRVLRFAARLVGGLSRYSHVSKFMLDDLHWLPLQQRIIFRLACIARCCALDLGPTYLCELFVKTSVTLGNRSLRSSARGDIRIPFARTATMQKRAFSVVGPTVWNDIPSTIRSLPSVSFCSFSRQLKTFLFDQARVGSASE